MTAFLKCTYAGRREVDVAAALALVPWLISFWVISGSAREATSVRGIAVYLGVGASWGMGAAVARWLRVRLVATRLVIGEDDAPYGRPVVLPPVWRAAIGRWGPIGRPLALRWAADAGAASGLCFFSCLLATCFTASAITIS